jgi:hypothetical protein
MEIIARGSNRIAHFLRLELCVVDIRYSLEQGQDEESGNKLTIRN